MIRVLVGILLSMYCSRLPAQSPELLLQTKHQRSIEQVSVSADGRWIATADGGGEIFLWDAQTGLQVKHLPASGSLVEMLHHPKQPVLLLATESSLWTVDPQTGSLLDQKQKFPGPLTAMAIHDNGTYLALAFDLSGEGESSKAEIRVYEWPSFRELGRFRQKHAYANAFLTLAFGPGEALYASGYITDVLRWNWQADKLPQTLLSVQLMQQEALAISPDGNFLACQGGQVGAPTVGIWDIGRNAWHHQFEFPLRGSLNQLQFSADGKTLVAGFQQGTYDATGFFEAGQTQGMLVGYDWQAKTKRWETYQAGGITDLALDTRGQAMLAVDLDRNLRSILSATGERLLEWGQGLLALESLQLSPSGEQIWVGGTSGRLFAWNWTEGQLVDARETGLAGPIHAIGFHPTSGMWAAASGTQVRIFDRGHQIVDSFSVPGAQVASLLFTRKSPELVVVSTQRMQVFQSGLDLLELLNGGNPSGPSTSDPAEVVIRSYQSHITQAWHAALNYPGWGTEISMHPQRDSLFLAGDQGQYLYDLTAGDLYGPNSLHEDAVRAAAFSPNGRFLAMGGDDEYVSLIDALTGETFRIEDVLGEVSALTFSSDEQQLAIADGDRVEVWRLNPFEEGPTIQAAGRLTHLAFDPSGKTLLLAGPDIGIELWDVASREKLINLLPLGEGAYLSFTPDGYYRASKAGSRGAAFRWGEHVWTFDQFDQLRNRPDLILERLGHPDPAEIKLFQRLVQGRDTQGNWEIEDAPQIESLTSPTISPSADQEAQLSLHASSPFGLERLEIRLNGVPLPSQSLNQKIRFSALVEVPLLPGLNQYQVRIIDQGGRASLESQVQLVGQRKTTPPDLYFVGLGVNDFEQANRNLRYAEQDVDRVLRAFQEQGKYRQIHQRKLIGKAATREEMAALRRFLEQARPEDRIVFFASTHGVLSETGQLYLATSSTDFRKPAMGGVPFSDLDQLLADLPCLHRLMLLDACYTGEQQAAREEKIGPVRSQSFPGTGRLSLPGKGDVRWMKDLFVDLRRTSGTTVIASSGGRQSSFEDPRWKSGLFTYVWCRLLQESQGEAPGIRQIERQLAQQVFRLSRGAQQPMFRQENGLWDWTLW